MGQSTESKSETTHFSCQIPERHKAGRKPKVILDFLNRLNILFKCCASYIHMGKSANIIGNKNLQMNFSHSFPYETDSSKTI